MKATFAILILFLTCTCLLSTASAVSASDRCASFKQEVRRAANRYLGLDYPYWYNLGQLKQESGCREGITAFDGGQGLAQFMPKTEAECEASLGALNMYNPSDSIKAQAWYLANLDKQNPDRRLCFTYMFYNSGTGTIKKEASRTSCIRCHRSWDFVSMWKVCKRKVLTLKSGKKLNLCDVGYDYPKKVYIYGQQYKVSQDRRVYW